MNRSDFLKTSCLAASSLFLANCTTTGPSTASSKTWPPVAFKTVRAFAYDCEAEHGMSFWKKDGRMHKGVLNAPGIVLSPSQVQRLVSNVVISRPINPRKPCYVPHHAFVFYDAADKPVATLEICFTCRRFQATPPGLPEQIGYDVPWAILKELNVPAERDPAFYRQLYRKLHKKA